MTLDPFISSPWVVWSPEHDLWFIGFGPELAAKYFAQGCAVMLTSEPHRRLARPYDNDWPEPMPDEPPYMGSEIVWNERAARYLPEHYGKGWDRIREYLERVHVDPVDVVLDRWRSKLGEWGGGYNMEADGYGKPAKQIGGDIRNVGDAWEAERILKQAALREVARLEAIQAKSARETEGGE